MNKRQQAAFDRARDYVLCHGLYEAKDIEVRRFDGAPEVYVTMEIGMPNDAGTLAESLCRSCYKFFIGQKGGMYTYNDEYRKEYLKVYDLNDKAEIYRH